MKEIGSEFWKIESEFLSKKGDLKFFEDLGIDVKYLMSGRTAIDYVLNDIEDNIKLVYMPDYCCNSMVQPFVDNGYSVEYYKVDLINKKYYIDDQVNCSIFFGMSYFGYENSNMDNYIKKFKKRNIVVLEDITHRLFCQNNYCKESDYLIASLRKWLPIYTGANINIDCKNVFLDLFNISNKLITDYKNRKMDEESLEILKNIDIDDITKKRICNTKIIQENFIDYNNIRLLYNYKDGDCPLFVPIISKSRDNIRKKLIKNNIYCPIHWPNFNYSNNEIYTNELSLICDQRYNEEDMKKEIKIIFENI